VALNNMALLEVDEGDLDAARDLFEQALVIKRQLGEQRSLAIGLAAHRDAGHPHDTVEAMIGLGRAWQQLGRAEDALRELRAAEALAAEIANPQRLAEVRAALAEAGQEVTLPGGLTARQAEVLGLLASGLSNKEIAGRLYLSPATVERHLATVYRKLGVTGRVEAARYAMTHGLAAQPPVL
jgi:DNA-binding NarL/FixJ family response regulator